MIKESQADTARGGDAPYGTEALDSGSTTLFDVNSSSKKLPQLHEIEGMIELLTTIKENYSSIHPMNHNHPIKFPHFVNEWEEKKQLQNALSS